ncbi:MAG: VOC family protein [Pseudomonadota bacterium]
MTDDGSEAHQENFSILRRGHGLQVDHVGLGVGDTESGVKWLSERTGAPVHLREPEEGQWYWSGSLPIAENSFLEVIGPNPRYSGFQPFKMHLSLLEKPALLFWYICVDNFQNFLSRAKKRRVPIERVEEINLSSKDPDTARYKRGFVGPGFLSQRPNIIEWAYRPDRPEEEPLCSLTDFRLAHPSADKVNPVFETLGIDIKLSSGPSSIGITLETPNGAFSIDNEGMDWTGLGLVPSIFNLWLKHQTAR